MNIGLVVNARGKMCLVHDEFFEAQPLWIGYHVDKRMLEIIFDTGATFPINWEATDDMDAYLQQIKSILIIRMHNKKPVEGYDTSFLQMRAGRVIEKCLNLKSGMRMDDRHGQLCLAPGSHVHDGPPQSAVYDGLSRTLRLRWADGTDYAVGFNDEASHLALLRQPQIRYMQASRDANGKVDCAWIPIAISMAGTPEAGDPPQQVNQLTSHGSLSGYIMSGQRARPARAGKATEWDRNLIWQPLSDTDKERFLASLKFLPCERNIMQQRTLLCVPAVGYVGAFLVCSALPGSTYQWFAIWQPHSGQSNLLDGSEGALDDAKDTFGFAVTPETACAFIRFDVYFIGDNDPITLFVETVEDIPWNEKASEDEIRAVASLLQPMTAAFLDEDKRTLCISGTALKGHALFTVKIGLALEDYEVTLPDESKPTQIKLGNYWIIESKEIASNLSVMV